MKRRMLLVAAAILSVSIMAAGCSKPPSEPQNGSAGAQTPSSDPAKQVTLRFATWDTGDLLKIQETIARQFEAKHPGVKVQVEAYGDGFDQKLAASIGANNAPDVMYMWDFPTYSQNLEPLDAMMSADAGLKPDDFYPGLFNYVKIGGKTYGMPAGFTTRVMYYNKKLFNEANVPYPKAGWTWDDFKETAKKLTNPAKKQYGFGVRAENDPYDLQGVIWSNGGSFISPDGKSIEGFMNGKETAEVLQLFGSLVKDKTAVIVGGKNQQSGDDIFKAGKIAMWESGVWPLGGFKEAKIDVGTVIMPAFPGKKLKGVISESAVSISKSSKNKELAWEFVKYYASDEAIKLRTSDLPVRKSVVAEKKLDQDPLYQSFYKMLETCDDTPAFLLNPKWNEVNRNLRSAISTMMLGQNGKDSLDKAVKDSEKFFK
ncbi:sugar ABC transporter substrate-binding protein [Paenibacillus sp. MZ04-78.2]|uniref:ABC transporter substrate-binding protein n=1 Tax=Paenibacillus sp. MZ04-78.2 TaxID=2962034 RepID=UPI0020B6B342|nr:sugar ABC transporter substrate-binding protein [Paenibacillus sp. MZ04-78.2]MCP3773322.1 sugar ABC transporter substrate-binding protein [Paenibacillus sp. MZ04-78.2]